MTSFSHGAGCGCKISLKALTTILKSCSPKIEDPRLLVDNDSRDDAAVYDMGNGTAIISTTDFFLPIVDDPFTFGRIAAINAISDIYAMVTNNFSFLPNPDNSRFYIDTGFFSVWKKSNWVFINNSVDT